MVGLDLKFLTSTISWFYSKLTDHSAPDLPINVKARLPHVSPNFWTVSWAWLHLAPNFLPLKHLSLASCLVDWQLQAVSPLDFQAICKKNESSQEAHSVCSLLLLCVSAQVCTCVHKVPLPLFPGWSLCASCDQQCAHSTWHQTWDVIALWKTWLRAIWKEQIQQELLTGWQSYVIS